MTTLLFIFLLLVAGITVQARKIVAYHYFGYRGNLKTAPYECLSDIIFAYARRLSFF